MKKFIGIILCAALCVCTLCSCSSKKNTVLTIGEAEVDNEVFAYFYSEVYTLTESEGGDVNATDNLIDRAVDKCLEYVASITLFNKLQLTLTVDEKKNIADSVEEEWKLYGSYYTKAGISKQTVSKVAEVREYRTRLLFYYFGEGSEYEATEAEVEQYFDMNYVEFKAINGYFTTVNENGETVPISEEEKLALKEAFENKRKQLEDGLTFAEINDGNEVESTFIAVSNAAYPEGFLASVAALEYDKPAVIETEENIFLVVRSDAKEGEDSYFNAYRTKYIEDLRGSDLTDMLIATGEEYEVTREDSDLKSIAKDVVEARKPGK